MYVTEDVCIGERTLSLIKVTILFFYPNSWNYFKNNSKNTRSSTIVYMAQLLGAWIDLPLPGGPGRDCPRMLSMLL